MYIITKLTVTGNRILLMMSTTCCDEKGWAKEGNRISNVTLFSSTKHTNYTMRLVLPAVVKRLSSSWIRSCCCWCFPAPLLL